MGFASTYLEKRAIFPQIVKEEPDKLTGIIVVVPAFNETGIGRLLDSLGSCRAPECKVEVIIVVNAPAGSGEECIENNRITLNNIESWKKHNENCFFRLYSFLADSSISGWGVGLARKTGMDEAVRRFNDINNPEGIILNLDADCLVAENYFESVYKEFYRRKDRSACSVYFEHPLSGSDFDESIYKCITLYELHLRYYYQGLAYTGFPYVFHTVGSAIAVRAISYIRAGGMNRRLAGEDFYFIQKLVPAGGYFNLNTTTVFPSPRASDRVPFGTGASIGKLIDTESAHLLTYNIRAFYELHSFFNLVENFHNAGSNELLDYYNSFPVGLKSFIDEKEWLEKLEEINGNTSGLLSFKKRFFGWFNMFKIVKYLNYVHLESYEKTDVAIAASELLEKTGLSLNLTDPKDLLLNYRALEKNF
jgi:hypothetical protein